MRFLREDQTLNKVERIKQERHPLEVRQAMSDSPSPQPPSSSLLLYGRALWRGGAEPYLKDATPEKYPFPRTAFLPAERNSFNSDEIYRNYIDVWLFGA